MGARYPLAQDATENHFQLPRCLEKKNARRSFIYPAENDFIIPFLDRRLS